jgi:hypothetical protein
MGSQTDAALYGAVGEVVKRCSWFITNCFVSALFFAFLVYLLCELCGKKYSCIKNKVVFLQNQ